MLQMKVTAQEAEKILKTIQHPTCQEGVKNHWCIRNGQPTAQSICWLFCWATTGQQGSDDTIQEAQRAFDDIFDCTYDWLNSRARFTLDIACKLRYKPGDIENKFRSYL